MIAWCAVTLFAAALIVGYALCRAAAQDGRQ